MHRRSCNGQSSPSFPQQIHSQSTGQIRRFTVQALGLAAPSSTPPSATRLSSSVCELLQCRAKTQAAVSNQNGAKSLGPVVRKSSRKAAGDSSPPNNGRTNLNADWWSDDPSRCRSRRCRSRSTKDRADKHAVTEDQDAAVAGPDAIEHMDVNRIKPVLHQCAGRLKIHADVSIQLPERSEKRPD